MEKIILCPFIALICSFVSTVHADDIQPKIRISKETTYITEPLTHDGLPDYEAYLYECGREWITPGKNAAVPLWRAFWPGDLDDQNQQLVLGGIGVNERPNLENALVGINHKETLDRIEDWLRNTKDDEVTEFNSAQEVVESATTLPWKKSQIPPLAIWLKANEYALDQFVKASKCERCWSPSPTFLNGKRETLLAALLPLAGAIRDNIGTISVRPLMLIGENRPMDAWRDILAMYKVANHVGHGFTVVELLVAYKLEQRANELTVQVLQCKDLSSLQLRAILKDLADLKPHESLSERLDFGERIVTLGSAISCLAPSNEDLEAIEGLDKVLFVDLEYDRNYPLIEFNKLYNRMVAIAEFEDKKASFKKTKLFHDYLDQQFQELSAISKDFKIRVKDRNYRARITYLYLLTQLSFALDPALESECRSIVCRRFLITACALAINKIEVGKYPNNLSHLVPEILSDIPIDPYSGSSLLYTQNAKREYTLYSVHQDGSDDGGLGLPWNVSGEEFRKACSENKEADLYFQIQ